MIQGPENNIQLPANQIKLHGGLFIPFAGDLIGNVLNSNPNIKHLAEQDNNSTLYTGLLLAALGYGVYKLWQQKGRSDSTAPQSERLKGFTGTETQYIPGGGFLVSEYKNGLIVNKYKRDDSSSLELVAVPEDGKTQVLGQFFQRIIESGPGYAVPTMTSFGEIQGYVKNGRKLSKTVIVPTGNIRDFARDTTEFSHPTRDDVVFGNLFIEDWFSGSQNVMHMTLPIGLNTQLAISTNDIRNYLTHLFIGRTLDYIRAGESDSFISLLASKKRNINTSTLVDAMQSFSEYQLRDYFIEYFTSIRKREHIAQIRGRIPQKFSPRNLLDQ